MSGMAMAMILTSVHTTIHAGAVVRRFGDGDACTVAQLRVEIFVLADDDLPRVRRRLRIEARDLEHGAEHAKHLPARTRIGIRLHDAVEILHAALAAHEGP